jgi:hypothetical protein
VGNAPTSISIKTMSKIVPSMTHLHLFPAGREYLHLSGHKKTTTRIALFNSDAVEQRGNCLG